MSGHTEPTKNLSPASSATTTITKAPLSLKNLASINSKQQSVLNPLSGSDNNKGTQSISATNNITQQFSSDNRFISNNQLEFLNSSSSSSGSAGIVNIVDSVASINNRSNNIDLNERNLADRAIDFFSSSSSDKESPTIGDSWKLTGTAIKATNKSNQSSLVSQSNFSKANITSLNRQNQSQSQFESLLPELANADDRELKVSSSSSSSSSRNLGSQNRTQTLYHCDSSSSSGGGGLTGVESRRSERGGIYQARQESQNLLNETSINSNHEDDNNIFDDDESESVTIDEQQQIDKGRNYEQSLNNRAQSPSYFKRLQRSFSRRFVFNGLNTSLVSRILTDNSSELAETSEHPYSKYEDKDLLTGTSKYNNLGKRTRKLSGRGTFRGSYKYSRARISMAIFKKFISLLVQRSTLALFGAFLIHVTLGTVYTLSNINSYLTSYMRKHGSPNATYGGSMWISSLYAVGQGFSMVLGGYIEKRFSARVACFIGCALHSMSIMSTSWAVNHGPMAVLLTYGFMPGFGCGLAYMTPMSNGFGWFPNRKGLVAGVILAGFGIGTFIFNMAQTAYVNPENLSPPENAEGYFTQQTILAKVPQLFIFIGTIYAAMQFVGCCLLFKPPSTYGTSGKGLDERPILVESEMPLKRSIQRREFIVLFLVYGITTQGVLFVNSMIKEYGQIFIGNDMYLAWTGSMASIANSLGRLLWGLAIDRFSFTQCFTSITIIFGSLMFIMPFEFILSSKLFYLLCTLGIFGSFSGWMSTYPVHLSRVFGRTNSGMIYGLIFISQSLGGILTALGAHYLIDHYNRFVPFFCVVLLEIIGLAIYHLFYPK